MITPTTTYDVNDNNNNHDSHTSLTNVLATVTAKRKKWEWRGEETDKRKQRFLIQWKKAFHCRGGAGVGGGVTSGPLPFFCGGHSPLPAFVE